MHKAPTSFWLSPIGRKITGLTMGTASTAALIANYLPHTILLSFYKDHMHLYNGGEKVVLSPVLQQRFQNCLDILKIDDWRKKFQNPFTVFGFDLFHAGNWDTRQGSLIGIPANYMYKSESDIDKSNLQVGMKPVKWGTPAGQQLAESLIVPERLQTFGICRELLSVKNYQFYLNSIYASASIFYTYAASKAVNMKLDLYAKPKIVRLVFYTLHGLFALGVYCLATDMTQLSVESDVDKQLCELGPEFIKDGIAFYDNILKRNIALRELLGDKGESLYTGNGNDIFYFREKTTPITERKKFFEDRLKELESKSE